MEKVEWGRTNSMFRRDRNNGKYRRGTTNWTNWWSGANMNGRADGPQGTDRANGRYRTGRSIQTQTGATIQVDLFDHIQEIALISGIQLVKLITH